MFTHRVVLAAGLILPLLSPFASPQKKRITVLPLRDRTSSGINLNISQKVADQIMNKLTETGQFSVFTRENLAAVAAERGLKFDADFDPKNAPKSGMQKVCDYIVTGEIVEFSENQTTASKSGAFNKSNEVTGTTSLKIQIAVISTETGEQVTVAQAQAEKSAPLTKSNSSNYSVLTTHSPIRLPTGGSSGSGQSDRNAAMTKLVDDEIASVSEDVAKEIAEKTASGNVSAAAAAKVASSLPKFVGVSDGLAMISRGSSAGIKAGQQFDVMRVTPTGMTNPETGKPMTKSIKVCTLTLTSVDEDSAGGKCAGGAPQAGDVLRVVNP